MQGEDNTLEKDMEGFKENKLSKAPEDDNEAEEKNAEIEKINVSLKQQILKPEGKLSTQQCSLATADKSHFHIRFEEKVWKEYYPGGNIKYPPVDNMQSSVPGLIAKMMLFNLLMTERESFCPFNPFLEDEQLKSHHAELPAIIIPSGGKDQQWLGRAVKEKNFWWTRFLGHAQVIFVVSIEEKKVYEAALIGHGCDVIAYQGFGIGCGRATGVVLAKRLKRVCIMTDDRTQAVTFKDETKLEPDVKETNPFNEQKSFKILKTIASTGNKGAWICSTMPFFRLNVLTVIDPRAQCQQPTFPKYFIASKEDMALHLYINILQLKEKSIHAETYAVSVSTDTNNPNYENVERVYKGAKGEALQGLTNSQLYRSSDGKRAQDWKALQKEGGFLNLWDAIKMQEAAMFQLLQSIEEDIVNGQEVDDETWQVFEACISPWFSEKKILPNKEK